VIHCVKAWEELLAAHKKFKPDLPWLVHGFRGKKELGQQLIKRGMYLSFWFDFIIRPESMELIKSLPKERIFLETDGADISITEIYQKVSAHLELPGEMLKKIVFSNFIKFFKLK
jgi:TatD DNase family protein